jgi:hypothetical protein
MAHRDIRISWKEDGTLEELPAEFQPARLLVGFKPTRSGLKEIDGIKLQIAGHETSLPRCIFASIRTPGRAAVRVLASWYHDTSILPPYVQIEFFDSDPDSQSAKQSRIFLFNLVTVRLREVQTASYVAHGSAIKYDEVDVASECAGRDLSKFLESPED